MAEGKAGAEKDDTEARFTVRCDPAFKKILTAHSRKYKLKGSTASTDRQLSAFITRLLEYAVEGLPPVEAPAPASRVAAEEVLRGSKKAVEQKVAQGDLNRKSRT